VPGRAGRLEHDLGVVLFGRTETRVFQTPAAEFADDERQKFRDLGVVLLGRTAGGPVWPNLDTEAYFFSCR